jgi:hypothetical protein
MAEGRRAVVDGRLDALESGFENLQGQMAGVKRKLGRLAKGTFLVLEGGQAVEALFAAKTAATPPEWRALKQETPEVLCKEVADHLGVAWPPAGDEGAAPLVKQLFENIASPGTLVNILPQSKYDPTTQAKTRIPGTFVLQLEPGLEMFQVKSVLGKLDEHLRRASGLAVRGQDPPPPAGGGAPARRLLLYCEKTAEERAKGKEKGAKGKAGGKAAGAGAGAGAAAAAPGAAAGAGQKGGKGRGNKGKGGRRGAGRGA